VLRAALKKHSVPSYQSFVQVIMDIAGAHEAQKYAHHKLDTIICNGVSMYFPSADYLLEVIKNSVGSVVPGGAFFLGDVRANAQFPHFHASVQLFQAPDSMPVEELVQKVCCAVRGVSNAPGIPAAAL
jgi:alanine-alpha-ketoisovalerate/valine-pyruvate aminotransferase